VITLHVEKILIRLVEVVSFPPSVHDTANFLSLAAVRRILTDMVIFRSQWVAGTNSVIIAMSISM
jgi:hypothetical protein